MWTCIYKWHTYSFPIVILCDIIWQGTSAFIITSIKCDYYGENRKFLINFSLFVIYFSINFKLATHKKVFQFLPSLYPTQLAWVGQSYSTILNDLTQKNCFYLSHNPNVSLLLIICVKWIRRCVFWHILFIFAWEDSWGEDIECWQRKLNKIHKLTWWCLLMIFYCNFIFVPRFSPFITQRERKLNEKWHLKYFCCAIIVRWIDSKEKCLKKEQNFIECTTNENSLALVFIYKLSSIESVRYFFFLLELH